ncbi:RNA binding protein [Arthrobacter phage Kuleana]|uniref:RNA binding protein n=1 Tax=Arthrobacter phage Kuleana TaxID=2653270 RepID=A0A5Q2WBY1_9CAUD|nr:RNA binding protein [Arthrobacter phage Kuleana]QGH74491.1 RNA binding protein [Arthrobacter phage Kuleana]
MGGSAVEVVALVLLAAMGVILLLAGGAAIGQLLPRREPAAPPSPWEIVTARRCVVNLRSGSAIDGVLVRRDGPLLFLKNAVLLEQGQEPSTIDGEAVVQASHVDFIQAL